MQPLVVVFLVKERQALLQVIYRPETVPVEFLRQYGVKALDVPVFLRCVGVRKYLSKFVFLKEFLN